MRKLISSEIQNFFRAYRNNAYKGQRLGQAFINITQDGTECNPQLFYANDHVAAQIIWSDYLEKSE